MSKSRAALWASTWRGCSAAIRRRISSAKLLGAPFNRAIWATSICLLVDKLPR